MKLDDYQRADCTLFRQPPIDVGQMGDAIELVLVEAWKSGTSAQQAIDKVLTDTKIVDTLIEQVAQNLAFQKNVALESVEQKSEAAVATYEASKQEALAQIEESVGAKKEEKAEVRAEAQKTYQAEYATYSKAQAELDALRQRAEEKIAKIGGQKGLETLLKINEAMTTEVAKQVYAPQPVQEEPSTPVVEKVPVQPLEQKVEKAPEIPQKRGFWKSVWKVLTYKIW